MPTAEQHDLAAKLHAKQLADGERILSAPPKEPRVRVSPDAYGAAERFYAANQLNRGVKPNAISPEAVKELMSAGVLRRDGHARGTTYTLLKRPNDLHRDDSYRYKETRTFRTVARQPRPATAPGILTIGSSEKAYIRGHVREYLAFATSAQSRKHEEKRQSENILDLINARAKEILKESRDGYGPRMTPLDASRQAQVEVALDFETLLKTKWDPIMFELFGMEESADTDMRTMRR